MFFVSVASKRLSPTLSPLIATFTREDISVASKELTRMMCWRESNLDGREDFEGVRRTAWRGRMVRRARKDRADLQNHYSILVQYVNDYFKWFECCGIAGCLGEWPS
jgi:hypothetical protein